MANRFTNQSNTAPVVSTMRNKKVPVKHSFFDLSRPISFDAAPGWIIPFDIVEALPDSDYEIQYDILALSRNPLVRRLLSGMTVYIHTYAIDSKDLWEGFPAFVARGRSGTITKQVPMASTIFTNKAPNLSPTHMYFSHQYSPSAYLGVPPAVYIDDSVSSDSILHYKSVPIAEADQLYSQVNYCNFTGTSNTEYLKFNVLPLVMYQQICVYNYFPSNLLQQNKNLFPDNEMHFRLPYDTSISYDDGYFCTCLSYDENYITNQRLTNNDFNDVAYNSDDTRLILDKMQVRQFSGDRFNTGLPWPELIRGDIPKIDLASTLYPSIPANTTLVSNIDYDSNFSNGLRVKYQAGTAQGDDGTFYGEKDIEDNWTFSARSNVLDESKSFHVGIPNGVDAYNDTRYDFATSREVFLNPINFQSSVTLSQLNALKVLTIMRQRAALTDGSYNELMKAQYNESPQLHVGKPFYIGGTKQPLVFSEVVQTSESSLDSPLGQTGSRAVSAGNGYIGKYHSKDFGYIMSVLSIVPDFAYTQGLDKMWTRVNHDDYHFPLMDSLAPQAILNKELLFTSDPSIDDDVFAYQERDSEYKSRQSVVRGGLYGSALDLKAYTMRREFNDTPSLSYGFTGMFPSNIDYSVFSNTIDTPFIFSINSNIRATLPLPYVTMPNNGLTEV